MCARRSCTDEKNQPRNDGKKNTVVPGVGFGVVDTDLRTNTSATFRSGRRTRAENEDISRIALLIGQSKRTYNELAALQSRFSQFSLQLLKCPDVISCAEEKVQ